MTLSLLISSYSFRYIAIIVSFCCSSKISTLRRLCLVSWCARGRGWKVRHALLAPARTPRCWRHPPAPRCSPGPLSRRRRSAHLAVGSPSACGRRTWRSPGPLHCLRSSCDTRWQCPLIFTSKKKGENKPYILNVLI